MSLESPKMQIGTEYTRVLEDVHSQSQLISPQLANLIARIASEFLCLPISSANETHGRVNL
jgi:hypothetical protein